MAFDLDIWSDDLRSFYLGQVQSSKFTTTGRKIREGKDCRISMRITRRDKDTVE